MQLCRKVGFCLLLFGIGFGRGDAGQSPYWGCFLPSSCDTNENHVICEGLSEIPHCFPKDTVSLIIRNSPDLIELPKGAFDDISDTLLELLIQQTDLKTLKDGSLRRLRVLETFEISSSDHLLTLEPPTLFSDLDSLQTLNFTNCPNLETFSPDVFDGLDTVQHLILRKCDIQNLQSNSFVGLPNLETLDLEDNVHLEYIPREALSHTLNLRTFYFSSCDMSVLYPDYFDSSFQAGHLNRVVGTSNEWDCLEICDFVDWLNDNPGFKSIAQLGYCATPNYATGTEILELDGTNICSPTNSVFLTFTVTVCIMTFILCICFCLVMKNCCFGMCKLPSNSTCSRGSGGRNTSQRRDSGQAGESNNAHRLSTISQLTVEGDETSDTYPEWNIYEIDPPSYSSLRPKTSDAEYEFEIELEDSTSMEGIPPPAYLENSLA